MTRNTFVLATRSVHKQREIQDLLGGHVRIMTLDDAGVPETAEEEGIEVFDTFRGNALAKARYFLARTQMPTIADDSGIMLDALDGAPGVRSRRFAQRPDLDGLALDLANNARALDAMRKVPHRQRTAHYMCAAVLVMPDGNACTALGSCSGIFLDEPRGNGGFGYDPHFFVPAADCTFAEMTLSEKHRYSHRARAFRALAQILK